MMALKPASTPRTGSIRAERSPSMTFCAPSIMRFTGRSTVSFRRSVSTVAQIRLRKKTLPKVTMAAIRMLASSQLISMEFLR